MEERLERILRLLRLSYGLVPIVAGVDKFTNLLANWTTYMSPVARQVLPFSPESFMYLVGVVEIGAGLLVLLRPRIGGYVVAAWLVAIAINLLLGGFFDIAVRDLVMAVGAFTLARLATVLAPAHAPARAAHARA